ncbi:hypothetical protein ACHAWC_004003 [Mediolabrus comicus]
MPKLQATVPKGLAPGSLLRVRLPDGSEVNVSVPDGLVEGDELIFETDSMGEVTASAVNSGSNNKSSSSSSSKKDSSSQKKSSKQAKKKNKKSSTTLTLNRVEEAPSFVTSFFETYNLLYDNILNILEGHPSPSRANYSSNSSNDNEYVPLLDRDIATGADFCVALCVGIFIGLSIVMGFITGVLWVVPINAENTSHIEVRAP